MFVRLPTQIDETGLILAAFAENERNMDVLRIEYYNREVILFRIFIFFTFVDECCLIIKIVVNRSYNGSANLAKLSSLKLSTTQV